MAKPAWCILRSKEKNLKSKNDNLPFLRFSACAQLRQCPTRRRTAHQRPQQWRRLVLGTADRWQAHRPAVAVHSREWQCRCSLGPRKTKSVADKIRQHLINKTLRSTCSCEHFLWKLNLRSATENSSPNPPPLFDLCGWTMTMWKYVP